MKTKNPSLRVNNIYTTISGECGISIRQGTRCVVLRLQGCNLSCPYCDAPDARNSEGGQLMTDREIIRNINLANGDDSKRLYLLVTGGEPLLQWSKLQRLFNAINTHNWDLETFVVQIETNGTIVPKYKRQDGCVSWVEQCSFIVDIKLPSMFSDAERGMNLGELPEFNYNWITLNDETGMCLFKIVVGYTTQIEWVENMLNHFPQGTRFAVGAVDNDRILLGRIAEMLKRLPGRKDVQINYQLHKLCGVG